MRLTLPRLFVTVFVLAAPAFAATADLPNQGLEDRIEFWKKVYTQYGKDDVIIHDRIHVNLIYDVAGRDDKDSKIEAVATALDQIRANLDTPENLSPAAKQIRDAIVANGVALTESSLENLSDNIHTQVGIKERFRDGIIRSGRYVESFQQIFEKEGVPTDVALLPLVESSFENQARSSAGAAGIWQFTRGTGRLYLSIGRRVDQRLDPDRATRAAARLLKQNYDALGSWPLAITAYNHGRGGMMQAKDEVGSSDIAKVIDEYQGRLFGYASMNFYSEFLAAVDVYNSYEQYFGALALDKPASRPATAVAAKPAAKTAPVQTAKAAATGKYKVRRGDTLYDIAQKFGLSVRELMDSNNLRNSVIRAGQMLVVE